MFIFMSMFSRIFRDIVVNSRYEIIILIEFSYGFSLTKIYKIESLE